VSQASVVHRLRGMGPRTAIIIGAGPAGLVAAIHLRRAGVDVTVLEAKSRPGGRAASDVQDGFTLNQGPHALYLGGAARRELKALGLVPKGHLPLAFGAAGYDAQGKRHGLVQGSFARLTAQLMRAKPEEVRGMTAREWLGDDPHVVGLTHVATYVGQLDRLSADAALGQLRAGGAGVHYLDGGWQQIVDLLTAEVADAVHASTAVRALQHDGATWTATTDDGEHSGDVVIVASGGPERAAKLLDTAIAAPGPEAVASVLDVGVDRLPRRFRRFGYGIDVPRYLSVHSPPAKLAERGVLFGTASYGRASREDLEAFTDLVQPGWRERAVLTRYLPSMTTVTAIPTPETGGLPGRPGVAVPGLPGAFVAGDWVGPEGMLLDAAVSSAVAAARAASVAVVGREAIAA
jgi:phytoene dehydrogenase-like protein